MADYKEYLKEKLIQLNLRPADLSRVSGITASNISKYLRGDTQPTMINKELIERALEILHNEKVNNVNSVNSVNESRSHYDGMLKNTVKQIPFENFEEVPFISINAQAGWLDSFLSNTQETYLNDMQTMLIPKQFDKGKYLVAEVVGDSMDDGTIEGLTDGDAILIKELPKDLWRNKLHYKQHLFVIVSWDGIVVKQIIDHDTQKGVIRCKSYNPKYPVFEMKLDEVYALYYVKKWSVELCDQKLISFMY